MPAPGLDPGVKRNKNAARDAEAICVAIQRPGMHFVPIKTVEQQCARALEASRDLLVRQHTQLINALRGTLAEVGVVAAQGIAGFQALAAKIDAGDGAIPAALLPGLRPMLEQVHNLAGPIDTLAKQIAQTARQNKDCRRLMKIPGIEPLSAHAIVAAIGDGKQFRSARDFVAWVGLTPKEASSGEKRRSGSISRRGDERLRRLLVLGASSIIRQIQAKPEKASPWIRGILARRLTRVAVVARPAARLDPVGRQERAHCVSASRLGAGLSPSRSARHAVPVFRSASA